MTAAKSPVMVPAELLAAIATFDCEHDGRRFRFSFRLRLVTVGEKTGWIGQMLTEDGRGIALAPERGHPQAVRRHRRRGVDHSSAWSRGVKDGALMPSSLARRTYGIRRRKRNREASLCVNETKAGTHGAATHGCRCERCHEVWRRTTPKAARSS